MLDVVLMLDGFCKPVHMFKFFTQAVDYKIKGYFDLQMTNANIRHILYNFFVQDSDEYNLVFVRKNPYSQFF